MAPALRMTRSIKEKLPVFFFIRYRRIFEVRCCSTVDSGVGSGGSKPVDVVHSYNIYVYTHILIYSVDKGLTTSPPLSLSLSFFFFWVAA